eukprot:TRINITY_DN1286_c0_g1_i1.p1 TRINITY_DN1286_c0_g1~~TRINITY_DN1286_c0_g1_i1.p1  ORF type:complete len:113 (-),score=22.03 TRINITY_DN1286_c0_g1_i1:218-556(-)
MFDFEGADWGGIQPGETVSYTFNTAGVVDYFCWFHIGMSGTVTVVAPSVSTGVPGVATTSVGVTTAVGIATTAVGVATTAASVVSGLSSTGVALAVRRRQVPLSLACWSTSS